MARIYRSPSSPEPAPACAGPRSRAREDGCAESRGEGVGEMDGRIGKREGPREGGKQRIIRRAGHDKLLLGSFSGRREVESLRAGGEALRRSPRKLTARTGRGKVISLFEDGEGGFEEVDERGAWREADGTYQSSEAGDAGEGDAGGESGGEEPGKSPLRKLLEAGARESPMKLLRAEPGLPIPSAAMETENPFLGPRFAAPERPKLDELALRSASPQFTDDDDDVDDGAILHFTPPRRISPSKDRARTPPAQRPSPSKEAASPSKPHLVQIPAAPVRESLDAFWSQDVINDWNEQYSPRKMLTSPRKKRFATPPGAEAEKEPLSPSDSPVRRRSPVKTPGRSKEAREMRKAWEVRKVELAGRFLEELDEEICGGRLAELARETGGVKIVWSKKLNSTAGRAHWRRETSKVTREDGSMDTAQKHFASIELAEKVIDDEARLVNVVAHEFCHLCNFMISGVRNNPHGKEFKEWARKCSAKFADRGIEVTTKHSYAIDYKYVWECRECGSEYKRHSKSIDVAKAGCGKPGCKGRLVQTKPVPRAAAVQADGTGIGKTSGYQTWLKRNRGRIQSENPGLSMGGVMEVVGREYRAWKAAREGSEEARQVVRQDHEKIDVESKGQAGTDVDILVKGLEVVVLDD